MGGFSPKASMQVIQYTCHIFTTTHLDRIFKRKSRRPNTNRLWPYTAAVQKTAIAHFTHKSTRDIELSRSPASTVVNPLLNIHLNSCTHPTYWDLTETSCECEARGQFEWVDFVALRWMVCMWGRTFDYGYRMLFTQNLYVGARGRRGSVLSMIANTSIDYIIGPG